MGPMVRAFIRRAEWDDCAALAGVHVRSWQATYRGAFPDEFLDALEPADRIPTWEHHLGDDRTSTLVAEVDGRLVGFVLVGPERSAEGPTVGEVYAIYLEPDTWGRGIGRQLMAAAEDLLHRQGYGEAVLWVLDSNTAARRFYERVGWRHDGGVKAEPIFGQEATEVRYRRRLD